MALLGPDFVDFARAKDHPYFSVEDSQVMIKIAFVIDSAWCIVIKLYMQK